MSFTLIEVTHSFVNLDSTPASGVVAFRLSQRITNGSQSYASELPVHASLNSDGELSQQLPANNDPATVPQGSSYLVTLLLNGSSGQTLPGDTYEIVVPYNAPGGTVDLGTLLPSQVGPTGPTP